MASKSAMKSLGAATDQQRRGTQQPLRQQYRVLDEAARSRRSRQQLEQLERDNCHEDPHANLVMHKKAPKFEDNAIKPGISPNATSSTNGTPSRRHVHRARILPFASLLEEDAKSEEPNYGSAVAPHPQEISPPIPLRHFCSVCGFKASYTCVTCGVRYCSLGCLRSHQDTRCLKWTA